MRLLICGDREWSKPAIIETIIAGFMNRYARGEKLVLIEGCARGADKVACEYEDDAIIHEHYPADWEKYGKGAGPVRNRQMLNEGKPDIVIAFHDDIESGKGTKDMRNIAVASGVPTYMVAKQYPF